MGLLLLVRHGQASFGSADYDVLSPAGWEQAELLGAHLAAAGVRPTALVRGDMRRHRETLESMAKGAGWSLDDVVEDAAWNEFDHLGIVAGFPDTPQGELDRRQFQQVFEQATARWTSGEGEYDETYAAFRDRTSGAMARAVEAAGSGATVVAVTSGGVIAALVAALVDPDCTDDAAFARRWQRLNTVVVNSAVTRVVVGATGARLLTYNEHEHLPADLLTYR